MKNLRFVDRRLGSTLTAFSVLLAMMVPSLVPAFASADQITDRSIALSTSAAGATGVTYDVTFTVSSAGAGAFVIEFCNDSSVPGETCTAPTGFSSASAATTTAGATIVGGGTTANTIQVTKTIAASASPEVVFTGITNPSSATDGGAHNGLYARILTFADATAATAHTDPTVLTGVVDSGGASISITNSIGVTAAVRESMIFCVANQAITADCANAGDANHQPNITLGETSGGASALSAQAVSTGSIYTQLSTNAQSGAVVNLKSNATGCGGLMRLGAPGACDIAPATTGGFSAGTAAFGVKTSSATATAGAPSVTGTLAPVTGSGYNSSTYFMHYVSGDGTGVTSTYGDPFIDTAGAPSNNQNMQLTFGASVTNNTPAGTYSANLSLIATGKY